VIPGTNLALEYHVRRESRELSTLVSPPVPRPSWKEEVNRRVEAHKMRKGLSVVDEQTPIEERSGVSDRGAQAAARVAERFMKAPSYGEMQAAEARTALRQAEAATRAALEAQAAARAALDSLERSAVERAVFEEETENFAERFDTRASRTQAVATPAGNSAGMYREAGTRLEHASQAGVAEALSSAAPIQPADRKPPAAIRGATDEVETAKPLHANLIQFPRELVATRRIRPRLAESPQNKDEEVHGQLSIFEVDPSTISVEATASYDAESIAPAPSWSGPEWSSLDFETEPEEAKQADRKPPSAAPPIHLAPLEFRLMAGVIDLALVVGLLCAGGAGIAAHMSHAPSLKAAEFGAGVALVLVGILYQAFFLLTTKSTPGMMYAGISLCTFDDEFPTRAELRSRVMAMLASLLPLGLGFAWSIFDEDRLSWHDRLSRTYQRRC
jgi:uncharacterized RDD family membrane protein YckC